MIIPHKENKFINIRDQIWNYPESIFGSGGLVDKCVTFYKDFRPFSHIIVLITIFVILGNLIFSGQLDFVQAQQDLLIEGVVVGESSLTRINPLIPTNKQLENDLASLIYLPLLRVDSSGEVYGVLANGWVQLDEDGFEYEFNLKDYIYWHDGEKFTTDDVIATFEVLKALGSGEQKAIVSKQAELAQKIEITKIDNFNFTIKINEVIPTFYEDLSIGIMPKHIIEEVSPSTFSWARFNLKPIGTGPFIFKLFKDDTIILVANDNYFGGTPKIRQLKLIMYENGDEAVKAIKNGEIHILADPSTAVLEDLANWANIHKVESSYLYRRYQAMYFNLKEDGPEVFKDVKVRQAISSAMNREKIIEEIETAGEEALGPIHKNSWAFKEDSQRYRYDLERARNLLDEAGWEQKQVEGELIRMKEDRILRFELSYLDKYERQVLAEMIKSDLSQIGVIVNLDPRTSSDLNEALIATRNFEAVLYGVSTPIDPDRIRLWHSEAIDYPGMNISSYLSSETRAVVGEGQELERISLIDAALENGQTTLDRERRQGAEGLSIGYYRFQDILLSDCPVVFLYHPVFSYVVHERVKGVDLSGMSAPEDRYFSVLDWEIE